MKKKDCKVGQVWCASLSPTVGSEQRGLRPVYVVKILSPNTFLGFPLTTQQKDTIWQIPFIFDEELADTPKSYILLSQPRTLDRKRLRRKLGKGQYGTLSVVLDTFIKLIR